MTTPIHKGEGAGVDAVTFVQRGREVEAMFWNGDEGSQEVIRKWYGHGETRARDGYIVFDTEDGEPFTMRPGEWLVRTADGWFRPIGAENFKLLFMRATS